MTQTTAVSINRPNVGSHDLTKPGLDRISYNMDTLAGHQRAMTQQMGELLGVNELQLATQRESLAVQREGVAVQRESVAVQRGILAVNTQHLAVAVGQLATSQQQLRISQAHLVEAMKTVRQLDYANYRLGKIDDTLNTLTQLIGDQNALLTRSLNRLQNEGHELLERGKEALENGWYEDAVRDFEAAVAKSPANALAHHYLGAAYEAIDRHEDAVKAWKKSVFYGSKADSLSECLSLCALAVAAARTNRADEARGYLDRATCCMDKDPEATAKAMLTCDLAEGTIRPETTAAIAAAFTAKSTRPAAFLADLQEVLRDADKKSAKGLAAVEASWESLATQAVFDRTASHFFRELDDFCYLASQFRAALSRTAGGRFASLGHTFSDVLDGCAAVGTSLLAGAQYFTPAQVSILEARIPLRSWNHLLVAFGRKMAALEVKADALSGKFVDRLNMGLVDLPERYSDDVILIEVPTEEGDTLALTCHYALFIRRGIDQFAVPLSEYGNLRVERFPAGVGRKRFVVQDIRTGQTLLQGTTGGFETADGNYLYFGDIFTEGGDALAGLHEVLTWAGARIDELCALFLVLHGVKERLSGSDASSGRESGDFEVVDDDFEVVE